MEVTVNPINIFCETPNYLYSWLNFSLARFFKYTPCHCTTREEVEMERDGSLKRFWLKYIFVGMGKFYGYVAMWKILGVHSDFERVFCKWESLNLKHH